jgi:predicted enzyme related to lactoylglutathione lyase
MNLNNIMIGTDDASRLVEYYTKLFGSPGFEDGGFAGWQIGEGFLTVGHHSEVSGKNASPGRLLLNIESDDVKADFERMKAAGAIVVKEPYREDGWPENSFVATLADPDDNYFQLVTPMGPGA